jgi:sorting nexin-9/18/33
MSKAERLLSYSLLSLITSKSIASVPAPGITNDEEEEGDNTPLKDKTKGLLNNNGLMVLERKLFR